MTKLLLKKYFSEIEYLINSINMDEVLNLKNKIVRTKKLKGKIFILGNGGSSSTANHFAVDMTKNANIETISFSNERLLYVGQWVEISLGGIKFPEIGIHDASYVSTYLGDGKGNFKYLDNKKSGIFIRGQLRDIIKIKRKKEENFIFALNNDSLKILKLNQWKLVLIFYHSSLYFFFMPVSILIMI